MPNVTPLTCTIHVDLPRPFWLRCLLPEYLRAFWNGLMGRPPFDIEAAGKRIAAKIRYSVK